MFVIESRIFDHNGSSADHPAMAGKKFAHKESAVRFLNDLIMSHRPLSGAHKGVWWIRDHGVLIRFTLREENAPAALIGKPLP